MTTNTRLLAIALMIAAITAQLQQPTRKDSK